QDGNFLLTKPVELFNEKRSVKKLTKKLGKSEYSTKTSELLCVNCGACISLCGSDALTFVDGKFGFDKEKCTLCGLCSDACPVGVKLPPDA
ncbi:MAG TPA: 4Fe-4S binding protein, partial [Fervidobacterium sp.]|nr:4Fe-4S binding protein [Fervidobacterium sp.]